VGAGVLAMAAARMNEIATTNNANVPYCIGCDLAENGQIPWQASLQTTGHFCGASIISSTFLNCAAHCKKSSFTANVGDVDNTKGQRISAKNFIAHPRYNGNLIINDYGVIELSKAIEINSYAAPIAIIDATTTRPDDRTPLMSSGYGYYQYDAGGIRPDRRTSRYLRYTDLEYVSVARCRAAWPGQTIDNSVQCADKDGATICSGDSGGPLVWNKGGTNYLIGATSWAHVNCASTGRPQGWNNLLYPDYNAWVKQNANLNY